MLCVPPVSVEVVNCAWLPIRFTVPSAVVPSLNVTDPIAPEVTVAVNVTACPTFAGFRDDASEVVVPGNALPNTSNSASPVLLPVAAMLVTVNFTQFTTLAGNEI